MANTWRNDEDLQRDLEELSDFYPDYEPEPEKQAIVTSTKLPFKVPSNVHLKRSSSDSSNSVATHTFQRRKTDQKYSSLYDPEISEEEDEEEIIEEVPKETKPGEEWRSKYVFSGRGYSTYKRPVCNIRKPGGPPSFLEEYYETQKAIRLVSGFGYSNDVIEHTLKMDQKNSLQSVPLPEIGLRIKSPRKSSPLSRNKEPSPISNSCSVEPLTISDSSSVEPLTISDSNSVEPLTISDSSCIKPIEEVKQKPPPLYDILRQRIRPTRKEIVNINSKSEFPEL